MYRIQSYIWLLWVVKWCTKLDWLTLLCTFVSFDFCEEDMLEVVPFVSHWCSLRYTYFRCDYMVLPSQYVL